MTHKSPRTKISESVVWIRGQEVTVPQVMKSMGIGRHAAKAALENMCEAGVAVKTKDRTVAGDNGVVKYRKAGTGTRIVHERPLAYSGKLALTERVYIPANYLKPE